MTIRSKASIALKKSMKISNICDNTVKKGESIILSSICMLVVNKSQKPRRIIVKRANSRHNSILVIYKSADNTDKSYDKVVYNLCNVYTITKNTENVSIEIKFLNSTEVVVFKLPTALEISRWYLSLNRIVKESREMLYAYLKKNNFISSYGECIFSLQNNKILLLDSNDDVEKIINSWKIDHIIYLAIFHNSIMFQNKRERNNEPGVFIIRFLDEIKAQTAIKMIQ
ncbi:hypothetical protein A3Q56_05177, partial [Intoshia linei]